MTTPTSSEITSLLVAWSGGDEQALERLAPLVQDELRRLAKRYLSKEHAGHTLQTSALINEAYLRMIEWKGLKWENRAHFFGLAAQLRKSPRRSRFRRGAVQREWSLAQAWLYRELSGDR